MNTHYVIRHTIELKMINVYSLLFIYIYYSVFNKSKVHNVKRCRCRMSGFRNKCINNRAHSPRTCWRPRCPAPERLRIANKSATCLAVLVRPTAPASTYEGHTPSKRSKQPPELETPPLATSSRKSIMKYKGMRDNPHKRASCRAHSHGGELPHALTPTHGPAAARTHPRRGTSYPLLMINSGRNG